MFFCEVEVLGLAVWLGLRKSALFCKVGAARKFRAAIADLKKVMLLNKNEKNNILGRFGTGK